MPRITLVKKIKSDGAACRKCAEVLARLEQEGLLGRIDRIVVAHEDDPASEGMRLAAQHGMERAPFFIVENGHGARVYESYLQFRKEVLRREAAVHEELAELMERSPDLDFV